MRSRAAYIARCKLSRPPCVGLEPRRAADSLRSAVGIRRAPEKTIRRCWWQDSTASTVGIVLASVPCFHNPISPLQWLGYLIAIFGMHRVVHHCAAQAEQNERWR